MKRAIRIISLVMVLSLLLTVGGVFAASTIPVVFGVKINTGYTAELVSESGSVVNASGSIDGISRDVFQNVAKIKLSFKGNVGDQYVAFLLKGDANEDELVPTESNEIYYINQITATGNDVITIYPKNLTDAGHYRIYLSSVNGYEQIGVLNVANSWEEYNYLLGDVDGNGKVDGTDALMALRAFAKLDTLDDEQGNRADTDTNGKVDGSDALRILKKFAKLSISVEEG